MYDVVIAGGGVVGSSIARELSKYELDILVVERASDLCEGTSKANSGIAHAGYDAMPGTLKARLNVRGSKMLPKLAEDLDFLYRKEGSLVVSLSDEDVYKLNELKERGEKNGVTGLEIIDKDRIKELEPNLSDEVKKALFAPDGAIIDPFGLTYALAYNAAINGVRFMLNTCVSDICKKDDHFEITVLDKECNKAVYESRTVINAAGVYADTLHNMVSSQKIKIIPRKGEYMLLDTTASGVVKRTIFCVPSAMGKGVLVTPTVHGNILVGPTADDIDDKEDIATTKEKLDEIRQKSLLTVPELPLREVITSFSGLRARLVERCEVTSYDPEYKNEDGDFLIGEVKDVPGFIDAAGIESPGLTAACAIGEYVKDILKNIIILKNKADFKEKNEKIKRFALASEKERANMIKENKKYANIVCRCCTVTEGEILDALTSPVPATTADGVKRRTFASMGRCQAGFCNPKIVEIIAETLGISPEEVAKNDPGSEFLI